MNFHIRVTKYADLFLWLFLGALFAWSTQLSCADESDDSGSDSDGDSDSDSDSDSDTDTDGDIDDTPFGINGRLRVEGTFLVNKSDVPIQLRGMSTHGLQWYDHCITPKSLDVLANEWGADILRTSVYVQEGGYEENPTGMKNIVDKFVDELLQRGLYALIDWHQLNPGDPNYNLELALGFFEYMSEKHGHKGHVLYEICNEPSGVEWSDIYDYAMEVIPVIRANDPESVIIVGTPYWASAPQVVIGNELPFDNVMYTMHFYAAEHGYDYMDDVQTAVDGGIPVFVTEYGTQEASGDGPNDFDTSQAWLDLLAENKISWTNWNFSDDFRSGAVWIEDTCGASIWDDARLKEAGHWVKERILSPPDDFE